MIKIIGCMILVISSTLIGHIKASSYKQRTIELEYIIEMIKLMEMQMTYKKDTLAKVLHGVSETKACWTSKAFEKCSSNLDGRISLKDAWMEALLEEEDSCPLEKHDVDILNDLTEALGKSDTDGQKKIIESAMIRFQAALKDSRDAEHRMGRMYKALGTAAGIVAVIMVI